MKYMKISAFCLIMNPHKFGYPWLESIQSWLPFVDELVIIDGCSEPWVRNRIADLKSPKIRVVFDKDTFWEDDWNYSRMGKNFNRGYHECTGDIVIKFDVDYIAQAGDDGREVDKFKTHCQMAINQNKAIISFTRMNFNTVDRYFDKSPRDLAVNRIACKKLNIPVDFGLDMERWKGSWTPIVRNRIENGICYGDMINRKGQGFHSDIQVFNYGFAFSTKKEIEWVRFRHIKAEQRFGNDIPLKSSEGIMKRHISSALHYFAKAKQYEIPLDRHPKIIQEKLRALKENQQGYSFFGNLPKSKYYD